MHFSIHFCIRPISEAQIIAPETLAPTDVWNQTFNNAKAVKVYMIGTIKNDGGKVLVELKSESFYLKQGLINFRIHLLKHPRQIGMIRMLNKLSLRLEIFLKELYALLSIDRTY